jgi:uncharacterized protein (UPF0335 family)
LRERLGLRLDGSLPLDSLTDNHISSVELPHQHQSLNLARFYSVEVNRGRVEVAGDKLRAIVERIERIGEEIKELNEGKREIFQEAKSNGFDVKVIREIVRLRKQDQKEREEHESLLEIYLKAIKGSRVSKAA